MELKSDEEAVVGVKLAGSNRTFMELKFAKGKQARVYALF